MEEPSYQLRCSNNAIKNLHKLDASEQERVEEALEEVAHCEQPTNHSKCSMLEHEDSDNLYKVRVGRYRAVCKLVKPVFEVHYFGHRDSVYDRLNAGSV